MRKAMRGVTIRAMRETMKSTIKRAMKGAMKRGVVWAGVSVLSLSHRHCGAALSGS